jgi:hypothetical protein
MRITRDVIEFAASRVSLPATAEEVGALVEMFEGKNFKGARHEAESMVARALNRLRERGAEFGLSGTTEADIAELQRNVLREWETSGSISWTEVAPMTPDEFRRLGFRLVEAGYPAKYAHGWLHVADWMLYEGETAPWLQRMKWGRTPKLGGAALGEWREVWPAGVYGARETDWANRSVVLSTPKGTFRFFAHPYFEQLLAAEEKTDHEQMAYLLNLAETQGRSEYEPAR